MQPSPQGEKRQRGQILVLFELSLIVILGFTALVIDLGVLRNNRQILVNTIDAAALAGGSLMPVDSTVPGHTVTDVENLIAQTVAANYGGTPAAQYTISYRCLIGADAVTGVPLISRDVPVVCNPYYGVGGHAPVAGDFTGAGKTRSSACAPKSGDKCNVIVVEGSAVTDYAIAPVVGVLKGNTGTVSAAACKGLCGASPIVPVDLVVIMDRTLSMSASDVINVQKGAYAVLSVYDPAIQRVAIGTIGPSQVSDSSTGKIPLLVNCPSGASGYHSSTNPGKVYGVGQSPASSVDYFGPAPTDLGRWIPVGFTSTDSASPAVAFNEAYSTAGVVSTTSTMYKAISCTVSYTTGTNLDTPIRMAGYYLAHYGRPGVTKGIILETDGTPQAGDGSAHYTCDQANAAATAVKATGIAIYTIGYGVSGAKCPTKTGGTNNNSHETTAWAGHNVTELLTAMATNGKFYNAPASSAVADAFRSAAQDLAHGGAHLIQLYPAPVVTSVGSGAISGKYFTGVYSVTFGGAERPFTPNGDSSISVTPPPGTSGTKVHVFVRTPGGISADTDNVYTYP
jgi:hypothetical protein